MNRVTPVLGQAAAAEQVAPLNEALSPLHEQTPSLLVASILVVDDRLEDRLTVEAAIDRLGHRIVCASSGAQAVAAVEREEFAVALIDVRMPNLDGFATAAAVKVRERSRVTPTFFSARPITRCPSR